ncbi:MAG: hypothetical protein GOU98_04765 [Candidatus Altiarchaeota archaeon]|nr:hypothetical protein [Candidatus Altiarchaeota archaeon]
MNEIVFLPASMDISPEDSVVLKFPKITISLVVNKGKIYAEVLEKSKRETYKGELKDNTKELEEVVSKVMEKIGSIIQINHKK